LGQVRLAKNAQLVDRGVRWDREGGNMPHGERKGKHALGGWLGQVRLAINALLVKTGVGWDRRG